MTHLEKSYDAIIIGARAAGASTAMLMARAGMKVLAIDRQAYGSDTLSTHSLMRTGVVQLHRWGVLDQIAKRTPAVRHTSFQYERETVNIEIRAKHGVDALYAPRRTVLDACLVDAAREAGATILHETSFLGVERGLNAEIAGIWLRSGQEAEQFVRAPLIIGADGRGSRVAQAVEAQVQVPGRFKSAVIFGYFNGIKDQGYRWYFGPQATAGVIPTSDGQACVFFCLPPDQFRRRGGQSPMQQFSTGMAASFPEVADELETAELEGSLRGYPGVSGYMRACAGPGWALVGDAGYFKDPITGNGITDALRDAELVANAALKHGPNMQQSAYQTRRNALSEGLFQVTDEIASFDWDMPKLQGLHKRLNIVSKAEEAELYGDLPLAA